MTSTASHWFDSSRSLTRIIYVLESPNDQSESHFHCPFVVLQYEGRVVAES